MRLSSKDNPRGSSKKQQLKATPKGDIMEQPQRVFPKDDPNGQHKETSHGWALKISPRIAPKYNPNHDPI